MEQKKEEMIPRKKRLPLKERNPVIKKKPAIKELIVKEVEMEVLSEVWASSLELPAQYPRRSGRRKTLVPTVNNAENQNQNFPASIPKVSSVNNVKQEPSSSARTSETTVLTVNNVEEQKQNSAASISKASTSNIRDEELASPACDPKKNTEEVQLLNLRQEKELLERILKSNCEQKVPPDLDFECFDEYLIDPEKNSSQLEDEILYNGNSTGCPAEDFRFYGYISPEVWNRTKFRGNVGTDDDIQIPITFENRLLNVPLFVLDVWLDRLEAHMNC